MAPVVGLPQAPVLFELELDAVLQRAVPQFKAVAKHQAVERDLAIVVAERVTHSDVMAAVEFGCACVTAAFRRAV